MSSKFIVLFICTLVCINNVICSQPYNKNEKRVRGGYKYNHPPGAEEYEAIPVVVVYEDQYLHGKEGKSIKSETASHAETTTTETTTIPTTVATETLSTTDITELPSSKSTEEILTKETLKSSTTAPSVDKYQIPVAIVYDEALLVNNTKVVKKLRKRVKQRKRLQQIHKSGESNVTETSSKIVFKNSSDIRPTKNYKLTVKFDSNKGTEETKKEHIEEETLPQDQKNIKSSQISRKNDDKPVSNQFAKRRNGEREPIVPIIMSENYVFAHSGNFNYRYESGDGTSAFETGVLKSFDDDKTGESVVGSFSYKGEDGKDISLSYTADENGYRPVGDHLPTPPPIPPAIARALKYLATKTTPEPVTEATSKKV